LGPEPREALAENPASVVGYSDVAGPQSAAGMKRAVPADTITTAFTDTG